ncbi:Ditrans,polycis-undecaprenyl-diphosphate synthase ((2E,6E)-farnesyl-diphosphate specific) [Commensalibacter sp. Nvir]|uniref:polyprenyl diphosphate synthase n=1 Tax=Commensalibacter sp. Nvir TaxID=3069817 RepID=UPI002D4C4511|nr:Ditrans,polycis-undecaprenyl-diphosphate synthase ((2E,6E)-farnesyl-diphosphate specific) [Commensalibacter sp. Nvir]
MTVSTARCGARPKQLFNHNTKILPQHVAIIMDGNSRWARARGLPRIAGHKEGAQSVKRCIEAAINNQTKWLTLYAFSSENWRRTPQEVLDLTSLLSYYIKYEARNLHKEGVCVRIIGEICRFEPKLQKELHRIQELTKSNTRLVLILALSYGGRGEVIQAVKQIVQDVKKGAISLDAVDESLFSNYLFTHNIPDPDLIIRTSGECRLSNFLLWQSAYSELIFLETLWPDFKAQDYNEAIDMYLQRERRFGARPGIK